MGIWQILIYTRGTAAEYATRASVMGEVLGGGGNNTSNLPLRVSLLGLC